MTHLSLAAIIKSKVSATCRFTAVATPEKDLVLIITGCILRSQITPCEERPLQDSRYTNPSLLPP